MILLMMIHLSQVGQGLNNIIRRGIPCKMIKTWMQESMNDLGLTGYAACRRQAINHSSSTPAAKFSVHLQRRSASCSHPPQCPCPPDSLNGYVNLSCT